MGTVCFNLGLHLISHFMTVDRNVVRGFESCRELWVHSDWNILTLSCRC